MALPATDLDLAELAAQEDLFHAALPGTTPDNDDRVERQSRVVLRFGHSYLYVGTQARTAGSTLQARTGLPTSDDAARGRSFPITVRGVGVVGTVTVSCLPQIEDHAFVVEQLTRSLGL